MCWSATASVVMVGLGAVAVITTAKRGKARAIWIPIGYFTVMETLQAAGYAVVDDCGSPANQAITLLSYLHIAFQPLFINAFAMAIAPNLVSARMRRWVYGAAAASSALMLLRLVPGEWAGLCRAGEVMCGNAFCLVSGNWHIGWQVPLNGLYNPISDITDFGIQFPDYLAAVFLLPLFYGAWRFVVFHMAAGPVLAWTLTSNPYEMPAVWCLFSIGLLLIALSPFVRHSVIGAYRPVVA